MSRFQRDDLLSLAVVELLSFVNLGHCEGGVVSLFWPFDDVRYKPIYANVSQSLPNIGEARKGWPARWPPRRGRSIGRYELPFAPSFAGWWMAKTRSCPLGLDGRSAASPASHPPKPPQ